MGVQYSLASQWKHKAEEREVAARRMARIAVGLFIVCNVLAATSFSAQSRYANLCQYVGEQAPRLAQQGTEEATLNKVLLSDYCG